MPELPEVETVRSGLEKWVLGWEISKVEILHSRAVRNNKTYDLKKVLPGRKIVKVDRRGKYMWLVLDNNQGLIIHLGMSGQVLLPNLVDPKHKHLRVRLLIDQIEKEIHFVDQRTFGHMTLDDLEDGVPKSIKKIAPDVFESQYQQKTVVEKIRKSNSEVKKLLLDQGVMSGVGNIYADEALWRAKIHPQRIGKDLTPAQIAKIIDKCKEVMSQAIEAGGTSFDELYVNVNGESGYFDRSLAAYGQNGAPCPRPKCRGLITKARFMGRYSHFCTNCQPKSR
jgi:formamidopyrimidine-DNA glycosylase